MKNICYKKSINSKHFFTSKPFFWGNKTKSYTLNESEIMATDKSLKLLIDDSPLSTDIFKLIKKQASPIDLEFKNDKLTVFLPFDDLLLYSFIPDENFSMSASPKYKEFDFKIDFPLYKTEAFIYLRSSWELFVKKISEEFNLILYSTGKEDYTLSIVNYLDPDRKYFKNVYCENNCHLIFNQEMEITQLCRDINLFHKIPLTRKILLDSSDGISNVFSPDNIFVFEKFHPDDYYLNKDDLLENIYTYLKEISSEKDIREVLIDNFNLRQILINSKLI